MFRNCLNDSRSVKDLLSNVCRLHCDSAPAHLTKTIADIVKRLKDSSDPGVRDACRDTIGGLSRLYLNTDAVVVLFVEPLFEAMRERNKVVQSGAAMCMARMVESAATPPITSFQKLCPRICTLLSNPCFLAKASLLLVISSLSQVGAIEPGSLDSLLESIHDCLASTCWATRKAAADTLTALASHSSSLINDKTDFTLAVLENCLFDKKKAVRESVTEALQLWKNISGKCAADGASDDSKISSGEQLGSEKNGKTRPDLADLMKKEASGGSTLAPDSVTKEKGRLPDKKAVVILKNKAPASSNNLMDNRDSQPDGAMRDMADTASRNGQAGPRGSPRSEQHENEQMGNGDGKGYETVKWVWYAFDGTRKIDCDIEQLISAARLVANYRIYVGIDDTICASAASPLIRSTCIASAAIHF